jgi:hypothetical protein
MPEFLFRFEDTMTADGVRVDRRKFKVIKETPCGYWILLYESFDDKKWVSKVAKKRFAYPVLDDAITSFKARKRRQIEILEAQVLQARSALAWADPTGEYVPRHPRSFGGGYLSE